MMPVRDERALRVLMLTCHPNIRGPFPKILPLLAGALRAEGCHVVEQPWGRHRDDESIFDKIMGRIGDIARVWRQVKREQFDVMVVQTTTEIRNYSRDIPAIWLSRRRIPHVMVQFHGSTPEMLRQPGHMAFKWTTRALFRLVDGLIVSSSEERRDWQKVCRRGMCFTSRNPFPKKESGRGGEATISLPWKLPPQVPVLIYVGRLIVEKGIFDLLEAFGDLRRNVPCHLLIIGSGPAEAEFKTRVKSLGLADHVTVAGHVDEAILYKAYRAADVFVLPSWSEGLPTVLLEAMDAGLPIVTTRIRGAADYLSEGVHACLVPPRDPPRLAEALARVLADPELRAKFGQANRLKIKEFAPEAVAREYVTILRQVVALSGGGKGAVLDQEAFTNHVS